MEWYDSTCSMMARWQRGKLLESLAGVEHLLQPVMLLQPFRLILEVANIQSIAADRRVRGLVGPKPGRGVKMGGHGSGGSAFYLQP